MVGNSVVWWGSGGGGSGGGGGGRGPSLTWTEERRPRCRYSDTARGPRRRRSKPPTPPRPYSSQNKFSHKHFNLSWIFATLFFFQLESTVRRNLTTSQWNFSENTFASFLTSTPACVCNETINRSICSIQITFVSRETI